MLGRSLRYLFYQSRISQWSGLLKRLWNLKDNQESSLISYVGYSKAVQCVHVPAGYLLLSCVRHPGCAKMLARHLPGVYPTTGAKHLAIPQAKRQRTRDEQFPDLKETGMKCTTQSSRNRRLRKVN